MRQTLPTFITLFSFAAKLYFIEAISVELNRSNWDEITKGKPLFIKFCTQSCAHCKEMKIAWEVLEEEWEDNPDAIIGTIDCDVDTYLCEEFKINGTPTILYGDRNNLGEYAGDKSFSKMNKFAKQVLVPTCSPENLDACNEIDRERIVTWVAMPLNAIEEMIKKLKEEENNAKEVFDSEMAKLQTVYDNLNNLHVLNKASLQKNIQVLQTIADQRKQ